MSQIKRERPKKALVNSPKRDVKYSEKEMALSKNPELVNEINDTLEFLENIAEHKNPTTLKSTTNEPINNEIVTYFNKIYKEAIFDKEFINKIDYYRNFLFLIVH